MKQRTRLLGVDFGTVRVGLAITDAELRMASPLSTYTRKDRDSEARFFKELVEEEEVAVIILGLPIHLSGHEGGKAHEARKYGQWLTELTGLPVIFWDERFTSVEAEGFLQSAGLTSKRRKARRDRVAAQILLQSYLDAGCPKDQVLGPLDGK